MKNILLLLWTIVLVLGNRAFAQSIDKKTAGLVEKAIALPNQIKLHYVEQGDPAGIPVIFLHGYSDSWHSYELVLPLLPTSIHAYALSQRGHGNSSQPKTGYQPDDFADDVASFMNELKIKQAVIVGHSMGSTIAQCFAVRHPELTKSLVLVGSFANYKSESMAEFGKVILALKDPVAESFVRDFQQSTLVKPVPPSFFETVVKESTKLSAKVWHGVMQGLQDSDLLDELKSVNKPTLLIWGDKDALCPRADQDNLKSVIQGSQLLIYEGTGHGVHWEEPERFAKDLLRFIAD